VTGVSAEPTKPANGFRTRASSAALLVPILLGLAWAGPSPWALTIGALALIGSLELGHLLSSGRGWVGRSWGTSLVGVAVYGYAIWGLSESSLPWLAAITSLLSLAVLSFLIRPADWITADGKRLLVHCLGVLYIFVFASFVTRAHAGFWPGGAPIDAGPRWVFLLLFLVWASDTGAYLIGVRWGRRRLWPSVSPKKSWEGLGGGIAFTVLGAIALNRGFELGWTDAVAAGLGGAVGIAAPLGDLIESRLKREVGQKDSGHWIPGHGGVLDRFDALLFAAPFFYYYLQLLA